MNSFDAVRFLSYKVPFVAARWYPKFNVEVGTSMAFVGCNVVCYFKANVPKVIQMTAEWRNRVSQGLSNVEDNNVNLPGGWRAPSGGWRYLLEHRADLANSGFTLNKDSGADVAYAVSDDEREFIHWMKDIHDKDTEWCANLGLYSSEVLAKYPVPKLRYRRTRGEQTAHSSSWYHVKRHQFSVIVTEDHPEAEYCRHRAGFIHSRYPTVADTWAELEVPCGFYPTVPRLAYTHGLTMAARPYGTPQLPWSNLIWCAFYTLWIRNVAFELLSQAGAQSAGYEETFEGRLWHLSPVLLEAMKSISPSALVGEKYGPLLDRLIRYIEAIHWSKISPHRNKVPLRNEDGRIPVYPTADFVMFDVELWHPMVDNGLLAPADAYLKNRGELILGECIKWKTENIPSWLHTLTELRTRFKTLKAESRVEYRQTDLIIIEGNAPAPMGADAPQTQESDDLSSMSEEVPEEEVAGEGMESAMETENDGNTQTHSKTKDILGVPLPSGDVNVTGCDLDDEALFPTVGNELYASEVKNAYARAKKFRLVRYLSAKGDRVESMVTKMRSVMTGLTKEVAKVRTLELFRELFSDTRMRAKMAVAMGGKEDFEIEPTLDRVQTIGTADISEFKASMAEIAQVSEKGFLKASADA